MINGKAFVSGMAGVIAGVVLLIGVAWAADIFTVDQNGSIRLRVTSDGNVGAGAATTSPLVGMAGRNYLTIKGPTSAGLLEFATGEAEADGILVGAMQASDPNLAAADKRYANIAVRTDGSTAGNRGGVILLATKADGGELVDRMTIRGNGNVGVGTTTPDERLEVEWVLGGTDAEIGRGATDQDVTFVALRSPNGTKYYLYPNDAGVLVVTTTKP